MKKLIIALLIALSCGTAHARTASLAPNMSGSLSPATSSDNALGYSYTAGFSSLGEKQGEITSNPVLSNISSTTSAITSANEYRFITGGCAAPVIDYTHFSYPAAQPACGAVLTSGLLSNLIYGSFVVEFNFLGTDLEIATYNWPKSGNTSIYIDNKLALHMYGVSATAQAGAANTITLSAGSSSTTNYYVGQYVNILSGTGLGQSGFITSYNGSTKVATVSSNWNVVPDNTSVYLVNPSNKNFEQSTTAGTKFYPHFSFSGPPVMHHVKIITINPLYSILTNSSGSITKAETIRKPYLFVVGDSVANNIGSILGEGYANKMSNLLGMNLINNSISGTGFLAGSSIPNYRGRVAPPYNSWVVSSGLASGGTYTLSWNGMTTRALANNVSLTDLQTALDSDIGSGVFKAYSSFWRNGEDFIIIGKSTYEDSTLPLTITSSLTGTSLTPYTARWVGGISPNVPKDSLGNNLPFYIYLQGSVNDNTYSASEITTEVSKLISVLSSRFPKAKIILSGQHMKTGPVVEPFLSVQGALVSASSTLPLINGKTPYISTFSPSTGVGYLNGTTTIIAPSGASGVTTDIQMSNDYVHPTIYGHKFLGYFQAEAINSLLTP